MDSSNSTTFLLFDRDATILLKKSCADMLESHDKVYLYIYIYIYIYIKVGKTFLNMILTSFFID